MASSPNEKSALLSLVSRELEANPEWALPLIDEVAKELLPHHFRKVRDESQAILQRLEAAEAVVRYCPDSSGDLVAYSRLLDEAGRVWEALDVLNKALRGISKVPSELLHFKADLLERLGRIAEAVETSREGSDPLMYGELDGPGHLERMRRARDLTVELLLVRDQVFRWESRYGALSGLLESLRKAERKARAGVLRAQRRLTTERHGIELEQAETLAARQATAEQRVVGQIAAFETELSALRKTVVTLAHSRAQSDSNTARLLETSLSMLNDELGEIKTRVASQQDALGSIDHTIRSLTDSLIPLPRRNWTSLLKKTRAYGVSTTSTTKIAAAAVVAHASTETSASNDFPGTKTARNHSVISRHDLPELSPAGSVDELLTARISDFVRLAYRALLGRDADPTGFEYYDAALKAGKARETIIMEMATSPEAARHGAQLLGLASVIRQEKRRSYGWTGRIFRYLDLSGKRLRRDSYGLHLQLESLHATVVELRNGVHDLEARFRESEDRERTKFTSAVHQLSPTARAIFESVVRRD